MEHYTWFLVCITCNALLLTALAANVSRLRLKHKISLGDGGNAELLSAIRAHANGIEQVPVFALLILGCIYANINHNLQMLLVVAFTLARISHAIGMVKKVYIARRMRAATTYFLQIAVPVLLLVKIVIG